MSRVSLGHDTRRYQVVTVVVAHFAQRRQIFFRSGQFHTFEELQKSFKCHLKFVCFDRRQWRLQFSPEVEETELNACERRVGGTRCQNSHRRPLWLWLCTSYGFLEGGLSVCCHLSRVRVSTQTWSEHKRVWRSGRETLTLCITCRRELHTLRGCSSRFVLRFSQADPEHLLEFTAWDVKNFCWRILPSWLFLADTHSDVLVFQKHDGKMKWGVGSSTGQPRQSRQSASELV